jgi:hypothetical protein
MTPTHNELTLQHPGDLVAALPHLFGFHPRDSMIVVGLHGPRSNALGLTVRVDLPQPMPAELARSLLAPLAEHQAEGVVLLVIGGRGRAPDEAPPADLPHMATVNACRDVLADGGVPVIHRIWASDTVGGGAWRCYDETECAGLVPNPATTPVAELAATIGAVTHARREDLVATLAPEPAADLARRAAMLARLSRDTEPSGGGSPAEVERRLATIQTAIQSWSIEPDGIGPPKLTDTGVVGLLDALSDHRVRDTCLAFDAIGDVLAVERLWTALARAAPAPERAEPACLLAFSAFARGDGVLAGIALAAAEVADPGHRLSTLLRGALLTGMRPEQLRQAGIAAARGAHRALSTPGETQC